MKLRFEADAVEVEVNEFNILFIGFYTEENYLMIQKSLDKPDEQDIRLGLDGYHIERDDQSYGGYGGVSQILLERDSIEVQLDETGKKNLQCDGVKVDFETDDETFERLSEKLAFIFGDSLNIK
jgi:hypothetical protein